MQFDNRITAGAECHFKVNSFDCTLMLGDCMAVMKDFPNNWVNLTLTDIPYNAVNRDSNGLRNLNKGTADIETFDLLDFLYEVDRITKGTIIIFCGKEQLSTIYKYFSTQKGTVRQLVWEKTNPSPMNGQYVYLSGIENAVWFKKRGGQFNARCKNTVFRFPNGRNNIHPTQKNLDLMKTLVLENTNEGDIVFDPCFGSGTTGVACIETGRHFVGIERDDGFYNLGKRRIKSTVDSYI
jgi:site-specific DNA-methyltransferase (adenine-specific)